MSTAKQPGTPVRDRVHFETSEIRKAEYDLILAEEAQRAQRNAAHDTVIGVSAMHTGLVAETVAVTKRGHVYALPSMSNSGTPDWEELPPVPGTKAREWYDVNEGIKARIATLRTSLAQTTEDSE